MFVTRFIVHCISCTGLPSVLRCRVQTLPLTTHETPPTGPRAQRPFSPARPATCNCTHAPYFNFNVQTQQCSVHVTASSPGQSVLLHDLVSLALPVQPLPPLGGGGLLQRRTRVMLPLPHVVVHEDHGDQRPQFPSERA